MTARPKLPRRSSTLLLLLALCFGCAPEVGSDAWCEKMQETPSADWSANDVKAYAQNCILK